MCGLAGWFGLTLSDKDKQEKLFRLLMRKAQVRGTDSFGVAFSRDGKVRVHRGLGPVSRWLTRDRKRVARVAASPIVIGHTRAASRGEVTLPNAHPFTVGEHVGAHNGMISNSSSLMLGARYAPRGETDSEEALAWLVSEGLTVEAFRALRGWFAMTIVTLDSTELVLAVDASTPFAVARVGGGIVWHSLATALESSLGAVGIDARIEEVKGKLVRFPGGEETELSPSSEPLEDRPSRLAVTTRQMELEDYDA